MARRHRAIRSKPTRGAWGFPLLSLAEIHQIFKMLYNKSFSQYNSVIAECLYWKMVKSLTSVRNSKAVIIPSEMIKKYKLEKVQIEETEEGILIRSAVQGTNFQRAVEKLRKNKTALYKRMSAQANAPETIKYYSKEVNHS
jgi:hypothetical protein